jgi:hypothetical protein
MCHRRFEPKTDRIAIPPYEDAEALADPYICRARGHLSALSAALGRQIRQHPAGTSSLMLAITASS